MKTISQALLILIVSVAAALGQGRNFVKPAFTNSLSVGCTTLSVDVWQNFEFTTVDQSSLEANDHNSILVWGVANGGQLSTSTTGQLATISCPQGITDTGVKGLAINFNSAPSDTYVQAAIPSHTNNVTVAWWFKTVTLTANNQVRIFQVANVGQDACCTVFYQITGSQHEIRFNENGGDATVINVSANTFYWIVFRYQKGTTGSIAVYDTSGSQVGSTQTTSDSNNRVPYYLFMGLPGSHTAENQVFYWDNIVIDFGGAGNTPAFPILP